MLRVGIGIVAVLALAGCNCGPGLPDGGAPPDSGEVEPDAGAADAGAPDAGSADAGNEDAGVDDGGTTDGGDFDGGDDGGQADGGKPDAGASDAGANDAGASDAGAADAGASDAGANDAGATDAGRRDGGTPDGGPDLCDDVDNDGDGLIDVGPDGGPLTRPCPLTLGVCAGAVSTCIAGQWSACDYGPLYQVTERSCDGLDNDCDGQVDVSWKRVLLLGDAGVVMPPTLIGGDLERAQVIARGGQLLVVLPNAILSLDSDLDVKRVQIFPVQYNNWTYLFPNGSDWIRIGNSFGPSNPCTFSHSVLGDGGYSLDVDGGALTLGIDCHICLGSSFAATETGDGWVTAGTCGFGAPAIPEAHQVAWTWTGGDGGYARGVLDAGLETDDWTYSYPGLGSLILVTSTYAGPATTMRRFVPSTQTLVGLLETDAGGWCQPTTEVPFTYACSGSQGWGWFDADGGQLTPQFTGFPLSMLAPSTGLYALTGDAGSTIGSNFSISILDGGVLVPLVGLDAGTVPRYVRLHELGGRLLIATFPENIGDRPCPVCQVGDFAAQYICAP